MIQLDARHYQELMFISMLNDILSLSWCGISTEVKIFDSSKIPMWLTIMSVTHVDLSTQQKNLTDKGFLAKLRLAR